MDNQYYTDQYGAGQYDMRPTPAPRKDKGSGKGLAIAAFVIALVNLILCSGMLSIIAVPLAVVMAIVSLASHRGGKAFAIIGIVVSLISAFIFSFYVMIMVKVMPDFVYFVNNDTAIISEYDETGEVPEHFRKYQDPKFDKYWSAMGYEDFDGFFADFIKSYHSGSDGTVGSSTQTTTSPDSGGGDYDHSGEELVVLGY